MSLDHRLAADPNESPFGGRVIFLGSFRESQFHPIRRHLGPSDRPAEPPAHIVGEPLSFHIMEQCAAQSFAQPGRRPADSIFMRQFVLRKSSEARTGNPNPVSVRSQSDRAMGRSGELVPEGGLNQSGGEQLADSLKALHGFCDGFSRAAVHQVRMDEDTGLPKRAGYTGRLCDGDALLHRLQQTVRGGFQAGADGDAA